MGHARKQLLSIYVDAKCNLKCKYCALATGNFKIDKNDQVIDLSFAKRGILDFFRDYPSRGIRFYGAGEPTIELSIISEIIDFVKSTNEKNTYFELQSNGFFNREKAVWIEENMDFIWISFDGLPEYQNKNRPTLTGAPSSDVVVENIKFFSESDKIGIGVRATLTPEMFVHQREIIDFLDGLGIKYISVERAFASVNNQGYTPDDNDPIFFAKQYLDAFYYAKEKGIFYNNFNMVNFDEPVRFFCRSCIPYPHLTTDGFVSCCDMAPFGKNEYRQFSLEDLIYGKYDQNNDRIIYYEDKIAKIRQKNADYLAKTECKGCDIVYNCAGGCLGQSYNETGCLRGKSEWDCIVTKYLSKHMPLNQGLYPILHP